jgi:hypothetical protein
MFNQTSMLRAATGFIAVAVLVCGCASPRNQPTTTMAVLAGASAQDAKLKAHEELARLFPQQYRSVQRAVITVSRKQFTCDGVLEVSTNDGWNLAIVSNLGVVTGVRVNRDGSSEAVKVTPLFRESWAQQFVANDVRRLFVPPPEFISTGRLDDGRLVCETPPESDGAVARYIFSTDGQQWRELEILRSGRREYHAVLRGYRTFAGHTREVPAEIEVRAKKYQLHLRVVQLDVHPALARKSGVKKQPASEAVR